MVEHLCLSEYYIDKINLFYSGYVKFLSDFPTICSPEPAENVHCTLGLPSSCPEVVVFKPTLPVQSGSGDNIPVRSYIPVCCDLEAADSHPSSDRIKKTLRRASRSRSSSASSGSLF